MIKTYKQYLSENFKDVAKEPSSYASKEAKSLGLSYFGFGRYGKENKVSHIVVGGRLKPISQRTLQTDKHQKVIDHFKGLKSDKKLADIKRTSPEKYKKAVSMAQERMKLADQRKKDKQSVSMEQDRIAGEYEKYFQNKAKEVEETHKTLTTAYDWRGLAPEEKSILRAYSGPSHQDINKALTNPNYLEDKVKVNINNEFKDMPIKKVVDHLDSVLNKTSAPNDFVTYFGIKGFDPSKIKKGIFSFNGYRSTTLNPSTAIRFGTDKNNEKNEVHVMQVSIKKGDRGMYLDGNYSGAAIPGEREFLLPRNSHFKLTDKPIKIVSPDGQVINIYHVEVIPDPDMYS